MINFWLKIKEKLKLGWIQSFLSGPQRFDQIIKEIKIKKPLRLMEIGTWDGEFAVKMITAAQQASGTADVHYYGFDFFDEINKKHPSQSEVSAKLQETGAKVQLFQGDSAKTLPHIRRELPIMDFIFINGGDSLEAVQSDWEQAEKVMDENSWLVFDHYWDRDDVGVKTLVNSLDINNYRVEVWPVQDGFWIGDDWSKINLVKITKNRV